MTCPPIVAQQSPLVRRDILIRDARVFDGFHWRDDVTIAISDDRILNVTDRTSQFRGDIELDGSDWTIIPGLIDAHVHVLNNQTEVAATPWVLEQLEILLRSGVTSIQSTSDVTEDIVELRSRIANGSVLAPRLFITGAQIAATGGPKLFRCAGNVRCQVDEVSTETEVKRVVTEHASAGVNAIKFVVDHNHEQTLSQSLVKAIIEAAHSHGLPVYGHIDYSTDARAAVEYGLDALVHPVPWRMGPPNEIAEFLASREIPVISTMSLRAPWLGSKDEMIMPEGTPFPTNRYALLQHAIDVVGALHSKGVPIVVGTDQFISKGPVSANKQYMRELQLLVEAGLSTTDVLRSATNKAAKYFGMDDLGIIKPNYIADLVILSGDPEENVLELQSVLIVIKAGEIVVDNRVR